MESNNIKSTVEENNQFESDRKQFETNEKLHLDLIKSKKELEQMKQKLRSVLVNLDRAEAEIESVKWAW